MTFPSARRRVADGAYDGRQEINSSLAMLKFLHVGVALAVMSVAAITAITAIAAPVPPTDPDGIEAYRRLPYCKLAPDGKRLAQEPCRRPPTRGFAARRAAPAFPPPPSSPPSPPAQPQARAPAQEWHPTLVPRATPAMPATAAAPIASWRAAPPGAAPQPVPPPAVQPLNQCGIAGCRGADGTLYRPGAGDIVLDPSGRMCTRQGQWVHCP